MSEKKKPNNFQTRLNEYIDIDYWDRLPPEEKAWMMRFVDEEYGNEIKRGDEDNIHPDEYVSGIYQAHNARYRDLYTRSKVGGNLVALEPEMIEVESLTAGEEFEEELKTTSVHKILERLVNEAVDELELFGPSRNEKVALLRKLVENGARLVLSEQAFSRKEARREARERKRR